MIMRKRALFAALMMLSSPALAQQQGPAVDPTAPPPAAAAPPSSGVSTVGGAPPVGSPQNPGTDVGVDKVGDDGGSTKTVTAVPCSTAARETDGRTTSAALPARAA